jgi:hydrocephalus-inducing protein
VVSQPKHSPVDGSSSTIPLKTSVVADVVKYELASATGNTVAFKQTFMFQTRVYKFDVKNVSKSKMDFDWSFETFAQAYPTRPTTAKSAGAAATETPSPYTIEPARGTIPRESSQTFMLRFTPLEVEDFKYQLKCNMPGLPKKKQGDGDDDADAAAAVQDPLVMLLAGRSARPVCHFDLDESDYLQRRPAKMLNPSGELGALPQNVHVIEMSSLGTRVRNTKRFYVINPQNVSYEFTWEPEGVPNPAFRCVTGEGLMLAGKRSEMVFEYTPDTVAMSEAFYRFKIPAHGVSELFLFVGSVLEPKVSFDRSKVDLTALLLGGRTTETVHLVNSEHIPFSFNFERASFDFPGGLSQKPQVELDPVSGVVPPNGRTAVEIRFSPTEEKAHNFNLICNVKRKPTKLALNVKGEGYAIHDLMEIEEENPDTGGTELVTLASSNKGGDVNYVDFGMLHVNEKVTKKVYISNSGKFNYDFNWSNMLAMAGAGSGGGAFGGKNGRALTVKPEHGTVPKGDKVMCELTFHPQSELNLDGVSLTCLVAGSRNYELKVTARATQPALLFSFNEHDFGACFVAAPGAPPQVQEAILRVTNQEVENDVSFDCMIEKTSTLEVKCAPTVLPPDHTVEVPILFTARENKQYEMAVPFLINGTSNINVMVRGEGVSAKVELVSASMQNVSFSTLQIGQEATKTVRLVNRSKCPVSLTLLDELIAGRGRLEECGIGFFPAGETTLRPRETCNVEVTFSPLSRTAQFSEDLLIEVAGHKKKLLTVSGACTGMEVALETDTLPFGSVCENSQLTRHLNMENTGDMVTKFQWDEKGFGPDFKISPVEGFLAPFSSIKFEVTFTPKSINDDIRYEGLMCYLQGADPLSLTLTGKCIPQPDSQVNTLDFEARARQEQTKKVEIVNPTDKPWSLIPALEGLAGSKGGGDLHWRLGSEVVIVPAKAKAELDLIYAPHSMTAQGDAGADDVDASAAAAATLGGRYQAPAEHTGRLFIALPDGNALLYNLVGHASEPDVAGHIEQETPAKSSLQIKLPVENWMKDTQRFATTIEITGADFGEALADDSEEREASTFVTGAETLVVPPLHTRDFNLKFYAYKEGVTCMRVTFKNTFTGEFIFYNITATAVAPGTVDTYKLEAPVRQTAVKVITVQNPFDANAAITFPDATSPDALPTGGNGWWSCDNKDVQVVQLGEMAGSTEGTFEVRYRPLIPVETEAELVLKCAELGEYKYQLKLNSTAAGTERSLNFKAPLGASQVQTFRFKAFCAEPTTFKCSTGLPKFFEVQEKLEVPAADGFDGIDVSVEVTFEPEALGEVKDILTITSDAGGEYSCALNGQCTPALPQGPFKIPKGGQADMVFKNVFDQQREFVFACDNPAFTANNRTANIAAKASNTIVVKFTGTDSGATVAAKLLVTCPTLPKMPPWVYYLRGDNTSGK